MTPPGKALKEVGFFAMVPTLPVRAILFKRSIGYRLLLRDLDGSCRSWFFLFRPDCFYPTAT